MFALFGPTLGDRATLLDTDVLVVGDMAADPSGATGVKIPATAFVKKDAGGGIQVTRVRVGSGPLPDYLKAGQHLNYTVTGHGYYGVFYQLTHDHTGSLDPLIGAAAINIAPKMIGNVGSDHLHGVQFTPDINMTAGIITSIVGFYSLPTIPSGIVTEFSTVRASNPLGAGTITTLAALLVDDLTKGGTNWAVKSIGNGVRSLFCGGVEVGRDGTPYAKFSYAASGTTTLQGRNDSGGFPIRFNTKEIRFGISDVDATLDAILTNNTANGNLEINPRPTYATVIKTGHAYVAEAEKRLGIGFDNAVPDTQLHLKASNDKSAVTLENTAGPNKWTIQPSNTGVANVGLGFRDELAASNKTRWYMDAAGHFLAGFDNIFNIGSASKRIKEFFAGLGAINTSDARMKTAVRKMRKAEIKAGQELRKEIGIYQLLESIAEKGKNGARLHTGMTVQRAIEIMEANGLDPFAYGFICHNTWEDVFKQVQTNIGEMVELKIEHQRQKTRTVKKKAFDVEMIDGKAVRITSTIKVEEPVFIEHPLVDKSGNPVMVLARPAMAAVYEKLENGKRGKLIKEKTEAVYQQGIYHEPVMETVVETHEVEAEPVYVSVLDKPAGDLYGFRYDQLYGFILAAF